MKITVSAAVLGAGNDDPLLVSMENFCRDFESILPLLSRKHNLGVGDTLCAVLAVVGKAADITQNREPTAAVMEKWAETLRNPDFVIATRGPMGHA